MNPVLDALRGDEPQRIVLHDRWGATTAGQALETIRRIAGALSDDDYGPGRVAALFGPVSTRSYLCAVAAEWAGGGQVEVPTDLPLDEQRRIITTCEARHVIADPTTVDSSTLRDLAETPGVELLTLGPASSGTDLLAPDHPAPTTLPVRHEAREGEPNRITLTGGTTGRAKLVLRRHPPTRPPNVPWLATIMRRGPTPATVLKSGRLTGFGRTLGDAALTMGGRFVSRPTFDPDEVLRLLVEEGVTHLALSPHELRTLIEHPPTATTDLPHLRFILSATAATSPTLLRRAIEVFGPIVRPVYGQTEAGLISSLEPEDYASGVAEVLRSCGRPLPRVGVEVRGEDGTPVPPGRRGEIWVTTPNMMDEYLDRPGDTAHALQRGWLRTGDVGLLDQRGLLTVLGRASEGIPIGETVVFASEVDTILQQHPRVRDSATVDLPGSAGPTLGAVVVTTDPGVSGPELLAHLAEHSGRLPVPSVVRNASHIPRTYANEPHWDTLRAWCASPEAHPVAADVASSRRHP
ncbi:long-chain fatty acid--CoA ligase [Spiractinospora alimapuensis]|uniref:class I adenylate-forming enzyme family protein n=1 Tax=Spiractinospora alimapuensis TaxID=2820884 RepID=UPI001F352921|nr:fatty acid--CoA ligase family protein [Spiractinospora alimapuensis]QVQ52343.1 long-chain fatty acid--CoA ligase [Spiractinospora alimapuensis]